VRARRQASGLWTAFGQYYGMIGARCGGGKTGGKERKRVEGGEKGNGKGEVEWLEYKTGVRHLQFLKQKRKETAAFVAIVAESPGIYFYRGAEASRHNTNLFDALWLPIRKEKQEKEKREKKRREEGRTRRGCHRKRKKEKKKNKCWKPGGGWSGPAMGSPAGPPV